MVVDGDDPQAAISAPRFTVDPTTGRVAVEDHMDPAWIDDLRRRGHPVDVVKGYRHGPGIAHAIETTGGHPPYRAASDPRAEGGTAGAPRSAASSRYTQASGARQPLLSSAAIVAGSSDPPYGGSRKTMSKGDPARPGPPSQSRASLCSTRARSQARRANASLIAFTALVGTPAAQAGIVSTDAAFAGATAGATLDAERHRLREADDAELGGREQFLDGLGEHVGGRVPDDAAAVLGVGGNRDHLGVGVRNPAQVTQFALGVADHDDRVRLPAIGQTGLAHSGTRGGPGRDPHRGH